MDPQGAQRRGNRDVDPPHPADPTSISDHPLLPGAPGQFARPMIDAHEGLHKGTRAGGVDQAMVVPPPRRRDIARVERQEGSAPTVSSPAGWRRDREPGAGLPVVLMPRRVARSRPAMIWASSHAFCWPMPMPVMGMTARSRTKFIRNSRESRPARKTIGLGARARSRGGAGGPSFQPTDAAQR